MNTYLKTFIVSVLCLFVLAACGNSEKEKVSNEPAKSASEDQTITIKHAMGESSLPEQPKRVVILTNEGTEALLAMGVKPVGAVQSWLGDPWYDHITDKMEGVELVGTEMEVNLEKIAQLQPDLIIGNKVRQEAIYDKLNAIAPTVFAETLTGKWKDNFSLYAQALNLEEKGAEVLAQYDAHVEEVKSNLGDKVNQSVSVVRFLAGTSYLYYVDSFSGTIFEQVGFKRAEHQAELFGADNKYGNLSTEVGKELIPKMDADLLFYYTYAPNGDKAAYDTATEWTSDPLWKKLNAVQQGKAYEVSDAIWNTAGGVLAANQMLDELEELVLQK